jgi:excisionase family DNA binding protein
MNQISQNEINELILQKLESIEKLIGQGRKPFLTLSEAAEYLGISENTLYGYTSKRVIPFHKVRGRKIYFLISDLDNFVLNSNNRHSCLEEIEEKAATRVLIEKNERKLSP